MVGSYKTLIPADEPITWTVFKEGFRSTHIPDSLMELKRKEFLNLKQGDMPFMDFLNRFNYLAWYAPEEITTEARKVKLCRDRLNPETDYALSAHEIHSMKSLVDRALRVESSGKKVMEERKRKWVTRKTIAGPSRLRVMQRVVYRSPTPQAPRIQPRP
ncbi:hypothetical protein E2562_026590 [Oryza meyeriana var. granulata]|uniref:Retrotransposon gag domain-containing protein n=1 Tax=Oryza meyeriana var. granulata TaxID=110450 RepID=A0A6G1CTV0_9ORYZ|nr:hypothetical protein E2562_026590 [Oryza meyeriana var. granulata]